MKKIFFIVVVVIFVVGICLLFVNRYGKEYYTYCWGSSEYCANWEPQVCSGISIEYRKLHNGLALPDGPDMVCFGKLAK